MLPFEVVKKNGTARSVGGKTFDKWMELLRAKSENEGWLHSFHSAETIRCEGQFIAVRTGVAQKEKKFVANLPP